MNSEQKAVAQAIVNIFETGSIRGNYGAVTVLEGDTGGLSYGRSQTTVTSGNLYRLIHAYTETPGSAFGRELAPYLEILAARSHALDHDPAFRQWLGRAGSDPVMHAVQDRFFDEAYWSPALRRSRKHNLALPLSIAVVYDSTIHGSWHHVRNLTDASCGAPRDPTTERIWIEAYVQTRRAWLASRSNRWLRRTVYRMDAFLELIRGNKWNLELPLGVRGIEITKASLKVNGDAESGERPSSAKATNPSGNRRPL